MPEPTARRTGRRRGLLPGGAVCLAARLANGRTLKAFMSAHDAREPKFVGCRSPIRRSSLFSSGTTGMPKCIVNSAAGTRLKECRRRRILRPRNLRSDSFCNQLGVEEVVHRLSPAFGPITRVLYSAERQFRQRETMMIDRHHTALYIAPERGAHFCRRCVRVSCKAKGETVGFRDGCLIG